MKTLSWKPVPKPQEVARAGRERSVPASNVQAGGVAARATPARVRTILVPTDYSQPSRLAFELACALAGDGAARLTLLHVAEPPRVSSLGMVAGPPLPAGYRGAWESQLRLIRPRDPAVRAEYRIEEGEPAAAILRDAEKTGCDLIVLGARRTAGLDRLLRRGVSGRVSRHAPCPVVTLTSDSIRRGDMFDYRTILHPTDFSEPAMYALGLARDLARASGADLLVTHVAPVPLYRKRRHRREMEEALRRLAASDPKVRARGLLLAGDPASQIVSTATQLDCGLIVTGTAGRTGLGRLLRGSVSGAVRKGARCPVLSVRLPGGAGWDVPDFAAGQPAANGRTSGPAVGRCCLAHGGKE